MSSNSLKKPKNIIFSGKCILVFWETIYNPHCNLILHYKVISSGPHFVPGPAQPLEWILKLNKQLHHEVELWLRSREALWKWYHNVILPVM